MPDENPAGKPLGEDESHQPAPDAEHTQSEGTQDKDGPDKEGATHDTDSKREAPEPKDDLVTTHHQLRVGRRKLAYTATAGRVVLCEEEHKDGTFTRGLATF